MKKTSIAKNLTVSDAKKFADFYDEYSSNYEIRAERLQRRRWQRLQEEGL